MSQKLTSGDFRIICPGTSKLYVKEIHENIEVPDGGDLILGGGGVTIPQDINLYKVFIGSAEQKVVKIEGRVLTIIFT